MTDLIGQLGRLKHSRNNIVSRLARNVILYQKSCSVKVDNIIFDVEKTHIFNSGLLSSYEYSGFAQHVKDWKVIFSFNYLFQSMLLKS